MEEVFSNNKQVQVKTETITPDEVVSTKEWGPVEPVPKRARKAWDLPEPTDEERYFRVRAWNKPETEAQKKSAELRARYEQDRIIVEDGVKWYRTDWKTFDLFHESFFDSRWFRSVYWDNRTRAYESQAPYPKGSAPKPVLWDAPEDWQEETFVEFNERRKYWLANGIRLEHEDVIVGAKYKLFERPDHPVVRVIAVNCGKLPPKVLVKDDETTRAWWIFSNELDKEVHNSKRSIKNWQKRRRTAYRNSGTTIWDTVILTEGPTDDRKPPSFPNYRIALSA